MTNYVRITESFTDTPYLLTPCVYIYVSDDEPVLEKWCVKRFRFNNGEVILDVDSAGNLMGIEIGNSKLSEE